MTALTAARNTRRRELTTNVDPVAAAKIIYQGALVCLDASGNATPGAVATTLKARGRAEETVDNSGGSAGDLFVRTTVGIFLFANLGADAIDRAGIGNNAYIVDDQTVAASSGTNTRSVAGKIIDVTSDGVWVQIG